MARAAERLGVELTWPLVLGTFVLLAALRSVAVWQRGLHVAAMRHEFTDGLRERLYSATAEAAWPMLVRRRKSDLLHTLTQDVSRAGQGAMLLIQRSVTATVALVQVGLAFAIPPATTFGVVLASGVLVAASRLLVRPLRALRDELAAGGRAMHAAITELLGGLKLAKSEGAKEWHVRDVTAAVDEMRHRQLAFVRATTAARVLPGLRRLQQHAQQLVHVLPAWLHLAEMERELRAAAEPPRTRTPGRWRYAAS